MLHGLRVACIFLIATVAAIASAAEFTIGARTVRVPDGYEVELIAGPPLVDRPISVSRDELGRLYATDSAGMTDRADKQLVTKPHRIVRLEDVDGDGRYDKSVVFAEGMMFPEGCLWYEGSLYVAAPPEIWKLTDADGDGKAEQRSVWFDGKTVTGCMNDLHGPYLGLDGWFYWCKGAFAEQKYTLPNGKPFVTRSSHIFRARPDGTGIEPVLTGGMDNPVNVAFLTTGERILSCTFFQFPAAGQRDGLIHAIYGGIYGKKHDSIFEHKQTGDVMPVLVHEGAAAPCGLIAGSDAMFAGAGKDNLFACYFNLHKVVRHTLVPEGPTFKTQDEDFIACDHPDFHPTDVFEDADGSLIVVDTGGWYKVCCPTSQLAKPDVLGAIYRVRKVGTPKIADALGTKLDWNKASAEELTKRLADPRLFVQRRATGLLRHQGEPAVAALRNLVENHADAAVRRRAVWALAGMNGEAAREASRVGLQDADPATRLAAAHVAALSRDQMALGRLLEMLSKDNVAIARVAAEAIGRIGDKRAVPALLQAVQQLGSFVPGDSGAPREDALRIREHALIYALIEIEDAVGTAVALSSPSPQVQRAALVALDQMDDVGLDANEVIALLDHANPTLKSTGAWIVGHRPEWGETLVSYFSKRLARPSASETERAELAGLLARLSKSPAIQQLLATTLRESTTGETQMTVLLAMTNAGLTATPPSWLEGLAQLLPRAEDATLRQSVAAARQLPLPKGGHVGLKNSLIEVGRNVELAYDLRLDALLAAGPLTTVDPVLFDDLMGAVAGRQDVRGPAAQVLGSAALSNDQKLALLNLVPVVGPLELPKLLPAFERGPTEVVGHKLVMALRDSQGVRGLRVDLVVPLLAKYPPSVQEAGKPLVAMLNASAAEQAAHLDRLLPEVKGGDINRGHEVFMGKKAQCITCHTLGYNGGRLGPDLTNIGKARNERDLLEAIVYPSASFVRGYEPVIVELNDGRTVTGIIARESREEIVLAIDAQKTQHIARQAIEEIHPTAVSLMPLGMVNVLTPQELADLLAFLKNAQR